MATARHSASVAFFDEEDRTGADHLQNPHSLRPRRNLPLMVGASLAFLIGLISGHLSTRLQAPALSDHTVSTLFQPDPIFAEGPAESSNSAWAALIPTGRGFIKLQPGDVDAVHVGYYGISVFHQLHCLDVLRRDYYQLLSGGEDGGPAFTLPEKSHNQSTKRTPHHIGHAQHCFDYLRQALICAADPTLEKRNDTTGGVNQGWGTAHQCRDFEQLKAWAEKHRYTDAEGIAK